MTKRTLQNTTTTTTDTIHTVVMNITFWIFFAALVIIAFIANAIIFVGVLVAIFHALERTSLVAMQSSSSKLNPP
jgi:hypothetical protein